MLYSAASDHSVAEEGGGERIGDCSGEAEITKRVIVNASRIHTKGRGVMLDCMINILPTPLSCLSQERLISFLEGRSGRL